ncbi:1607_t:CDS:2, partial [Funneliformis geosporum]
CGKSVANLKFPKSGNPTYPHCNGGYKEKGKQEYERKNAEYQNRWEGLSPEEKLIEVKKEYRYGENVTELATRSAIPPSPTGNDNNFSSASSDIGSESNKQGGKNDDSSKNQRNRGHYQLENNSPENNSTGLIIGGAVAISFVLFATFLVIKGKTQPGKG